jgi:predicted lactoylglutathione lyase
MWIHLDAHTARQLDALSAEWSQKGAHVVEPPSVRAWGIYEMRVRDLDGHVLRVSAPPGERRQ